MENSKGKAENNPKPNAIIEKLLRGQKALVTGGNSGIGKGIATAIGKAGADVVVNYISGDDEAQKVVDEIEKSGSHSYKFKADVSDEKEVQDMFETMFDRFGTIDILINNAGIQRDAPIDEMTLDQWNMVLNVNLTGQFLCAREAIKEFKRRGVNSDVSCAAGKIICISSVHEVIPWAGHANYAASKGGVMLLMKSMAQEVASQRIRVNSIAPGAIKTPINKNAWETEKAYNHLMKLVPYQRIGEVDDIGRAAVWLASDNSDYVTGTSLIVDGGMTLYPGFATGG